MAPNQLLFQQKRFRGKINLKKPKIFYTRKVVNAIVTPFFADPNKDKTIEHLCAEASLAKVSELGPYDKILAKEIRNWFDQSRMVACVHVNSISEEDFFPFKVALHRANMYYKSYGIHLLQAVLEDSPYKDLKPLISKYSSWIFSPDTNVAAMEKILKKSYKLYLLGKVTIREIFREHYVNRLILFSGGILDGCVLNHADFLKYGQMDMTTAQLGLVQVLQSAGGANLNRQLTHHQTTLVTRLEQIGTNAKETSSENEQSVPV